MKRKSLENDVCPVALSLEAAGDTWSMLMVRDAFTGKRRFGEFQRSLGVAKNILTVRLRKLVALGVLEQVPAADGSADRESALTEKGRGLFHVLVALGQWGCGASAITLVDRKKGEPVRLELRSGNGWTVGLDDVRLVLPAVDRAVDQKA
ncbi:MAG TPA: helix-turn-helix domain-containing protein [Gemmataceae bacterium]|nr:helix-turn-helix domain-containing protein [Gemmataceae bacterium]